MPQKQTRLMIGWVLEVIHEPGRGMLIQMIISRASALGSRQPPRRRQHLAVGVSPWTTCSPRVEPRRRRQQVAVSGIGFWPSPGSIQWAASTRRNRGVLDKPSPALPCGSNESETIRNRPIPSRPWYPVTVHLNALVALRRSSCPFVDSSFSFVFFRLFQTIPAPRLNRGCLSSGTSP